MSMLYDSASLKQAADAALQRGDARLASGMYREALRADDADATTWLGLALAADSLSDDATVTEALDRALTLDPRNIRALVMRGDRLAAAGDTRAALTFYNVVDQLVPDASVLPLEAAREIRRVKEVNARLGGDVFGRLKSHLDANGYDKASASPRFAEALDLLTGRKRRYEQQPRAFYMPGMPVQSFYPREMFSWLDAIEAATDDITAELTPLLDEPALFQPYIEAEENRPTNRNHTLLDSQDWTACYLWNHGAPVPEIASRCPRTMKALEAAPLERIAGRSPFALFSKLTPGAWIKPHTGFFNSRLICHLPLIVPPGCSFRVGNETRTWERGKAFVFDDTIEHEARNDGAGTRVVLIFNIWQPALTDEERRLIATLIEGVDRIGG